MLHYVPFENPVPTRRVVIAWRSDPGNSQAFKPCMGRHELSPASALRYVAGNDYRARAKVTNIGRNAFEHGVINRSEMDVREVHKLYWTEGVC